MKNLSSTIELFLKNSCQLKNQKTKQTYSLLIESKKKANGLGEKGRGFKYLKKYVSF